MAARFTSSSYHLASQVKLFMAKNIHPAGFLKPIQGTNSIVKWTNSIDKVTNLFANEMNSIAKATNSIAKTCNYGCIIQVLMWLFNTKPIW